MMKAIIKIENEMHKLHNYCLREALHNSEEYATFLWLTYRQSPCL